MKVYVVQVLWQGCPEHILGVFDNVAAAQAAAQARGWDWAELIGGKWRHVTYQISEHEMNEATPE